MKASYKHGHFLVALLVAIAAFAFAPGTYAGTLYWGNGGNGGPGDWDGATAWFDSSTQVAWSDANTAQFGGASSGAVTNDTAKIVTGLNFITSGYTISGAGPITLNAGSVINADTDATISNVLSGSNGFTKTGGGQLLLTGASTITGPVVVSAGTLVTSSLNNIGENGPLGPTDNLELGNCTFVIQGNIWTDRSFTISNGATATIKSDNIAGHHLRMSGSNTTSTTGALIVTGDWPWPGGSSTQVFLNGSYGFTGGVTVTNTAKGFNVGVLAGVGQPSSIGAVTGAATDLVFGGAPGSGAGRFLPGTTVASSTCGAGWTIRNGEVGQMVHFGTLTPTGNTVEFSGNAAATTGRLSIEGGTTDFTADRPYRFVYSGQNAFTGGVDIGCRYSRADVSGNPSANGETWNIMSVGTIANGGSVCNLGASSADANNLLFWGGWLEYTGATASTDRAFSIAYDAFSTLPTSNPVGGDAKFIITNPSTKLTMTGHNTVVTPDTYLRGLNKTGDGTLRLTGIQDWTGTTVLKRGATGQGGGTVELGLSAQTSIWTGGGADIQDGTLKLDYSGTAPDVLTLLKASHDLPTPWSAGTFRDTKAADYGLTLGWMDDITNSQVIIMATMFGDCNLDGSVTSSDINTVILNMDQPGNWSQGDSNYDGMVTSADLVPEPSSVVMLVSLLASAAAWAIARRREKNLQLRQPTLPLTCEETVA